MFHCHWDLHDKGVGIGMSFGLLAGGWGVCIREYHKLGLPTVGMIQEGGRALQARATYRHIQYPCLLNATSFFSVSR